MIASLRQLLAAVLSFATITPACGVRSCAVGGYVYDFENHLIPANGITYVYDGDGRRISKTVNGITTLPPATQRRTSTRPAIRKQWEKTIRPR